MAISLSDDQKERVIARFIKSRSKFEHAKVTAKWRPTPEIFYVEVSVPHLGGTAYADGTIPRNILKAADAKAILEGVTKTLDEILDDEICQGSTTKDGFKVIGRVLRD